MKISNIKKWSTEKLSQSIFYVLVGFAVITFFLFFFVGYDMPFEENPDFNAPFFTNLLLVTMWIFFLLALCLAIYSFVRAGKRNSKGKMKMNGIPAGNIVWITWGGTLVLLVLTFVLGSSGMILINGQAFTDWLWLKLSDMFIWSSATLLLCAIGAVLFGATRYIRKDRKRFKK